MFKRTWAEVNLAAVAHNLRVIRKAAGSSQVMCIVKADAYGHGAKRVSAVLDQNGADWFGVSNLEEAVALRDNGIQKPILILGYTPPEYAGQLCSQNISQSVFSPSYAQALSSEAVRQRVSVKAHFKIDTGMSRIGFFYQDQERDDDTVESVRTACKLPGLEPEGIFTHFCVSDEGKAGENYTRQQFENFMDLIRKMEQVGIHFKFRHCSNSGAVIDYPGMSLDIVRPGIILYGLHPSGVTKNRLPVKPVMSLRSVISQVKSIPKGAAVSYGRTFTAENDMTVATIPAGYADGYSRLLAKKGCVLVNGQRAAIIGRICMDQMMIDVTDISVKEGMIVTLFGESLAVDELAAWIGTINYEVVCGIGKRVPRVYTEEGLL